MINHMKVRGADEIIIERAHRTSRLKRNRDGTEMPRPIYCRFLNWSDKDYVIRRAPQTLKDNPFGPKKAKLIIIDDVSKKVRTERKILKEQYLPGIEKKQNVKTAFIPYLVPARIQFKEGDSWKFYFLPGDVFK